MKRKKKDGVWPKYRFDKKQTERNKFLPLSETLTLFTKTYSLAVILLSIIAYELLTLSGIQRHSAPLIVILRHSETFEDTPGRRDSHGPTLRLSRFTLFTTFQLSIIVFSPFLVFVFWQNIFKSSLPLPSSYSDSISLFLSFFLSFFL